MNHTDPLPLPLRGDKRSLSEEARAVIDALVRPRPGRFLLELLLAWGTIIASIALAAWAHNIFLTIAVIVIVASRQMLLGFLIHEQVHDLALPGRWGDLAVNLFAGYPLFVITVEGYARVHLSHHRYYFTERDPDFVRKSGVDWTVPITAGRLARLFLTDLLGLNLIKLIKGKRMARPVPEFERHTPPAWVPATYYALAAGIITATGTWHLILLYWILPLLTVTQAILRWGAICEHKYNLTNPSVAESAPIIVLRWWDKLLLPNLNFTLHPYHHYFPGIPHASLPRVHEIFRREGLVNEANVFHGYWSFLRFVLQPALPDRDVATAPRLPASSAPSSANLTEATRSAGRTLGGAGGIGGSGGGEGEAAIAHRGVQAGD